MGIFLSAVSVVLNHQMCHYVDTNWVILESNVNTLATTCKELNRIVKRRCEQWSSIVNPRFYWLRAFRVVMGQRMYDELIWLLKKNPSATLCLKSPIIDNAGESLAKLSASILEKAGLVCSDPLFQFVPPINIVVGNWTETGMAVETFADIGVEILEHVMFLPPGASCIARASTVSFIRALSTKTEIAFEDPANWHYIRRSAHVEAVRSSHIVPVKLTPRVFFDQGEPRKEYLSSLQMTQLVTVRECKSGPCDILTSQCPLVPDRELIRRIFPETEQVVIFDGISFDVL